MSNAFPTLRREAAALGLTKPQTDKLIAEATYDRKHGIVAHDKVFQTGRLLAASDADAQRLRDAAIADSLPARMKASSTSYAPGPATAPKPPARAAALPPRTAARAPELSAGELWQQVIAHQFGAAEQPPPEGTEPEGASPPDAPHADAWRRSIERVAR
jgi:hypothetical protein